jgi:starch synthase
VDDTTKSCIPAPPGPDAHAGARVLFVTSELFPLAKVGGLGDVSAALPVALRTLGYDVRVLLPAYASVKDGVQHLEAGPAIRLPGFRMPAMLWRTALPGSGVPVYLLDVPELFDRDGGPYSDAHGADWPDNATRFLALARAALEIGAGRAIPDWRPDLLHGNDWPSGYMHALAAASPARLPSVFTVHNMAHQGLAPLPLLEQHALPARLGSTDGMEFYGQLSALKGGLAFADEITTVSPTYALEIQTPAFGCGLDGVARERAADITGILNGVDYDVWDPRVDPHLIANYGPDRLHEKGPNKAALRRLLRFERDEDLPLIGFIGRLGHQKGVDLLLGALAGLADRAEVVVLGTGDGAVESALSAAADSHARVAVRLEQSEALAHRIEAGADVLLMPSRFEPCGLNQMYSLRYGTVPIVSAVGGLRDTITDTSRQTLQSGEATGFVFDELTQERLDTAIDRALEHFRDPFAWRQLQLTGMAKDFSWQRSARAYAAVYRNAFRRRAAAGLCRIVRIRGRRS